MKFGYTIIYVEKVVESVEFYERAFGLERKFIHEGEDYAEMKTGSTTLAFASSTIFSEMGNDEPRVHANRKSDPTNGFDLCFLSDNVIEDFHRAIEAGATLVCEPVLKPWGQEVGYLRDLNGCLVEIASPMAS